jgi:drug/metabolite transporter (DMT)-like permease
MNKRKISSSPLCLISAIVWGTAFPIQEIASKHSALIDAFGFGALRMIVAGIALIPVVLIFERHADHSKKQMISTVLWGALAGAVLFSASTFQQYGIEMTGESGKAGFITSLYLVFVAILSFVLFKKKPSLFMLIALPFAVLGLYFLSFSNGFGSVSTGDLLLLICSVLFAFHIIVFDKSAPHVNPLLFSCVQFFVAGFLSLGASVPFGTITTEGIALTAFPIIYCGVFSAGVAYTCQLLGQKNGDPTVCALFCSMEALFAVIAECIIEGEFPSTKILIGCILMLIAVVLSQLPADLFKKTKNA